MNDNNIYELVARRYEKNPIAILLFIASFLMLGIGLWLFVEDTYSSKIALENIQQQFGVRVQIFDFTYWIMSLAPQIASIIFAYMYMSNRKEHKWGLFALIAQAADFAADMWFRGNGQLLNDPKVFLISGLMTLLYFSIGSEFFISIGFGLCIKLFNPALRNFQQAWRATSATYNASHNSTRPGNSDANLFKKPQNQQAQTKKPSPSGQTRPLYNEPTYHPISGQSNLPSWMQNDDTKQ